MQSAGVEAGFQPQPSVATAAVAPPLSPALSPPFSPVDPLLAGLDGGWLLKRVPARSRRITLLLTAVVLVSIADLVMTLTFLTQYGLSEANPLARGIMAYRSPALVVLWKLASVTACAGIIYRFRTVRCAEVAAWVAFGVMVWLSFRWAGYLYYMDHVLAFSGEAQHFVAEDNWVSMAAAVPE